MKLFRFLGSTGTGKPLLFVACALAATATATAQTSVALTFTGGGGAPLTISWAAPITFTASGWGAASGGAQPFFVFAGLGDVYANHQYETVVATSPTYTGIDGTGGINNIFSGQTFNDVAAADVVFTSYSATSATRIAPGATFILAAGSLTAGIGSNPTSGEPFSGTLPTNGTYSIFVTDGAYHLTAIPEPSTCTAVLGALALAGIFVTRRRRAAAPAAITGSMI